MFCFRLLIVLIAVYASMTTFAFCNESKYIHESSSQAWKVGQRRWTIQEEYKYGKWLEANVKEDFFIRHKIRVDCADVPYAIRWIYARIHHLPAAARTVDNRLIGHWSKEWGRLPTNTTWDKDRRFRAALIAMLSSTATRTLPFDTYPIRIAADSVTPGTVFLLADDHAGIVSGIVMDGSTAHPIQTFEGGSPARVQRLRLRNFILPDPSGDRTSGLLKFRWPVREGNQWHYLPVKEHPFYSEEQYSSNFTKGYVDYLEAVAKRIDPKVYAPKEKTKKIINTLTRRLNERIPVVLEGNKKCHKIKCPEGSELWEIYSTPVRDEFIGVMIDHLEEIIRVNHLNRDAILDKMAKIRLQIYPDRFVTLQRVFQNFQWLSSDPEDTIRGSMGTGQVQTDRYPFKECAGIISFIQTKNTARLIPILPNVHWLQQAIVERMTRKVR